MSNPEIAEVENLITDAARKAASEAPPMSDQLKRDTLALFGFTTQKAA